MTLQPRTTPGASVTPIQDGWRLEIPAGPAGIYRLAQLDDYAALPRSRFPLSPPTTLSLRCRVSPPFHPPIFHQAALEEKGNKGKWRERGGLPGTWGFGFWNDPLTLSLGLQGTAQRLPVLPNAAWFFHASAKNYLSFRPQGDGLPGNGFMAQVFASPSLPSLLFVPGLVFFPLMFLKVFIKWIRALIGKIIGEESIRLEVDVTQWHEYRLKWSQEHVEFSIDGETVLETASSPNGPLGLVIWIDNQFAAFPPDGKISTGTEENPVAAWMEITDLEIM
jgi:hypothetical protein